jgi:hypothetical protein
MVWRAGNFRDVGLFLFRLKQGMTSNSAVKTWISRSGCAATGQALAGVEKLERGRPRLRAHGSGVVSRQARDLELAETAAAPGDGGTGIEKTGAR